MEIENSNEKGTTFKKIKYCSYNVVFSTSLLAIAVRYLLLTSKYQSVIANHIEISTPLNSWKRIKEGLHLYSRGIDPYDGDLIHETPIALAFYRKIMDNIGITPDYFFIAFDIATGVLLFLTARNYMFQLYAQQEKNKEKYIEGEEHLLKGTDFLFAPTYVACAYFFNPYTIFNCVGCSTTVFHNFFLSFFLYCMSKGDFILAPLFLAFSTTVSLYTVVLVVPMMLFYFNFYPNKTRGVVSLVIFVAAVLGLTYSAAIYNKNLRFLENVYGFILTVPDLRPNIGLFWYFFTEMFEHFRKLFIFSFQINASILYLIPLSFKFRNDPFVLTLALLFLITIFKSYPSVGDVGFVLSLLPCCRHLFNFLQQGFIIAVIFIITTCLGPIVWHLWIYSNSANANFYFGVTLAFAVAQIFLVTDILFANIKREFCLIHGKERKIGDEDAVLILE